MGCLAFFMLIKPLSFKLGLVAFISRASLPLAKTKSKYWRILWLLSIASASAATILDSSASILAISSLSLISNSLNSLFNSTTAIGSTKTVAPLELMSWTRPGIFPRFSCLTGITNLPSLMVTILSWRYFLWVCEFIMEFSLLLIASFLPSICLLMLLRVLLALSDISFSLIIALFISSSKDLKTLKSLIKPSIIG